MKEINFDDLVESKFLEIKTNGTMNNSEISLLFEKAAGGKKQVNLHCVSDFLLCDVKGLNIIHEITVWSKNDHEKSYQDQILDVIYGSYADRIRENSEVPDAFYKAMDLIRNKNYVLLEAEPVCGARILALLNRADIEIVDLVDE